MIGTHAIGGVETARPPEYAKSSQPVRADASLYPRASKRKGMTGIMTAYENKSVATPERSLTQHSFIKLRDRPNPTTRKTFADKVSSKRMGISG